MKNQFSTWVEWNKERAEIKQAFYNRGITYCEGRFIKCTVGIFLGFAHTKKRRNLGEHHSDERLFNIRRVALLCNNCHDVLEMMGEARNEMELEKLIRNRDGEDFFAELK